MVDVAPGRTIQVVRDPDMAQHCKAPYADGARAPDGGHKAVPGSSFPNPLEAPICHMTRVPEYRGPRKNSITAILPFSALCYSFKLIAVAFLRFGLCWREAMVDGAASIKGCCCPGGREMRGHGR